MNPWEGIATPADSTPQAVSSSPWDGIASPAVVAPAHRESQGMLIDGTPIPSNPSERSLTDKAVRQMELYGRAGLEGASGLADIPAAIWNATSDSREPQAPYLQPTIEKGLDAIGMPKPEDKIENIIAGGLRGVTSAKYLGTNPMGQTSGAIGGGTSEMARQLGYGPAVQIGAGLVAGGIGGPAAYSAGKGAGNLIAPFTESGRSGIADNIITNQADNPAQAAATLQNVPQYVPGSQATGGTASGDLGLIGMEKTLMQNPANYFGERLGQQNSARANFINQVAGDETTIPRYSEMRSNATDPLYEQAKGAIVDPKALGGVLDGINVRINQVGPTSDAGKTLIGLKTDIESTIPASTESNSYFVDPKSKPATEVPQSQLVQLYRENRDNLNKTGMQPGAYGASVKGIIKPLNKQLGAALEVQNPKLAEANALFQQLSIPIDQAKNMQTLVPKMTGGIEDLQGQNIFSPSKVGNIMKTGEMNTEYNGVQPLKEALSPEQYQALQAVNQDLQRSNAVNIPMVRPPGSNTFNNAASTAELTKSLAGHASQYVPFFGKAYANQNTKIMQAIADKMLEPEMTRRALLAGKTVSNQSMMAAILRAEMTGASGAAAGIGVNAPYGGRQ